MAQLTPYVLLQEAAVAADQERCAALARFEEQDAQLADLGQQLASAICTCRSAAASDVAHMQAQASELQVTQLTSGLLCLALGTSMLNHSYQEPYMKPGSIKLCSAGFPDRPEGSACCGRGKAGC